jgi:hypothetical protein
LILLCFFVDNRVGGEEEERRGKRRQTRGQAREQGERKRREGMRMCESLEKQIWEPR